jgi:hypothetical protein
VKRLQRMRLAGMAEPIRIPPPKAVVSSRSNRPRLEAVALACPAQRGEPRTGRPRWASASAPWDRARPARSSRRKPQHSRHASSGLRAQQRPVGSNTILPTYAVAWPSMFRRARRARSQGHAAVPPTRRNTTPERRSLSGSHGQRPWF